MTKAITNSYNFFSEYRMVLATFLFLVCILTAVFYAFNLYKVIAGTVALDALNNQVLALSLEVDDLDSRFLKLSGEITPDELADYGLVSGKVSQYISRTASLSRVAMGGHEL